MGQTTPWENNLLGVGWDGRHQPLGKSKLYRTTARMLVQGSEWYGVLTTAHWAVVGGFQQVVETLVAT